MPNWNQTVFDFLHGLSGRSLLLDELGVFLANYLQYFAILGVLVLIFLRPTRRQRWAFFLEATLAVLIARGVLAGALHFLWPLPRPFAALNFSPLFIPGGMASFPSGHAAFFFALAVPIFCRDRLWGWIYFGLAALISLARIFAGVHWPVDILGGAAVGVLAALIVRRFIPAELAARERPESETGHSADEE